MSDSKNTEKEVTVRSAVTEEMRISDDHGCKVGYSESLDIHIVEQMVKKSRIRYLTVKQKHELMCIMDDREDNRETVKGISTEILKR